MTGYTLISGEEAEQLAKVQRSLFKPNVYPDWWSEIKSPFLDESWKILGVSGHFHDSADVGKVPGWPRRDGMKDITSYLDPLFWHLSNLGRDHLIISINWEPWPKPFDPNGPGALYCRCPFDEDVIYKACYALEDELRKLGPYGTLWKVMAFDTHGDWATCDTEEEAHLLGGTPEFIDAYIEAAGGEEYVRA